MEQWELFWRERERERARERAWASFRKKQRRGALWPLFLTGCIFLLPASWGPVVLPISELRVCHSNEFPFSHMNLFEGCFLFVCFGFFFFFGWSVTNRIFINQHPIFFLSPLEKVQDWPMLSTHFRSSWPHCTYSWRFIGRSIVHWEYEIRVSLKNKWLSTWSLGWVSLTQVSLPTHTGNAAFMPRFVPQDQAPDV